MFCRTLLLKEVPCRSKHNVVSSPHFISMDSASELMAHNKAETPSKPGEEKEEAARAASRKVWELPLGKELNTFLPFCHRDTDRR